MCQQRCTQPLECHPVYWHASADVSSTAISCKPCKPGAPPAVCLHRLSSSKLSSITSASPGSSTAHQLGHQLCQAGRHLLAVQPRVIALLLLYQARNQAGNAGCVGCLADRAQTPLAADTKIKLRMIISSKQAAACQACAALRCALLRCAHLGVLSAAHIGIVHVAGVQRDGVLRGGRRQVGRTGWLALKLGRHGTHMPVQSRMHVVAAAASPAAQPPTCAAAMAFSQAASSTRRSLKSSGPICRLISASSNVRVSRGRAETGS